MNKKTRPLYMLPTRDPLYIKRHTDSKERDGKRYFMQIVTQKAGGATCMLDKTGFKTKAITRDKEGPSKSTAGYLCEETQNTNLKRQVQSTAIPP